MENTQIRGKKTTHHAGRKCHAYIHILQIANKKKASSLSLSPPDTRAETQKVSIWLSALVSWLQGLWDTPASWQSFLTQAVTTGFGFVCARAPVYASESLCVLFLYEGVYFSEHLCMCISGMCMRVFLCQCNNLCLHACTCMHICICRGRK